MSSTVWPRFGAFSYDFERGETDLLISRFTELGLIAVQWGRGLLDELLEEPEKVEPTQAALADAGIEVVGLAGYRNLIHPDDAVRRDNIDYIRRCLVLAPRFGSVVATETGSRHPDSEWLAHLENDSELAWELLHEALDELVPLAEANGVVLALEGYVNNVLATADQLAALLERYPTPALQAVLDPFNYLSKNLLDRAAEETADFLTRFKDRFVLAHLKDVSQDGAEEGTPAFGSGVFPFPVYLEFLEQQRPDLAIIIEHQSIDTIPATIEGVKRVIGA